MSTSRSRNVVKISPDTMVGANESAGRPARASSAPDLNPYLAGEVIGDRYRLVRELGRGGMGVVWLGYALALGVEVAVKLIRTSSASPALSARMAREANAAARLGHPALVRVFDFGWTSRGDPYLVMELVNGETLSACLAREGRISAIRAVQMLLPVADGLRLAHDRTIVHRDIKPDNIFLATDSLSRVQPKLLDFGIAKVGHANFDGRLTQVGVALGSPEYMSPEQALGVEDVDERTDIWSLAVVLYELVTGALPFKKPNYNALMQAIIHDPVTKMTEFGGADESLWTVVARGLSKERSDRWLSMAEFGEALALWLYEHGIKEDICGNSIRAVWLEGARSGVAVPTIPTTPPTGAKTVDGPGRRYSATANTVERLASEGRGVFRPFGRHRVVLFAAGSGALLGGIIAAVLLRGAEESTVTAPLVQQRADSPGASAQLFAWGAPVPASSSTIAPTASGAVPDVSTEPRALENNATTSNSVKGKVSGASTGSSKAGSKATKRRHDFGF